jgi:hypothetical protein
MPREDLPLNSEQFKASQEQSPREHKQPRIEQEVTEQQREQPRADQQERKGVDTGLKKKLSLSALRKAHVQLPPIRDEVSVKIEKVMEEGVGDAYARLSPVAKQEFKIKGEETANNIREMVKSGHAKAKKVFQLILEWLKLLPGVNKFFLEQEAKIKTDRIMSMKDRL